MSEAAVLEVRELTRVFRPAGQRQPAFAAVAGVTFTVRANEILGVIGPNGAGKTTLMDMLAAVLAPTSGSIRLDGGELHGAARRRIGYVPSGGRALYPRLSVMENLRFFAALQGICGLEAEERATDALCRCGAAEVRGARVDRLSDGFVARATLARALLHDPDLLLLDEPARSVDPITRPSILRGIREFVSRPGKAAVMVTHELGDVFDICGRVAVMRAGRFTEIHAVAANADRAALDLVLQGPTP